MPELDEDTGEEQQVRDWHVTCLLELGCSWDAVHRCADTVDYREVAKHIRRGCPPDLAVEIER